LFCSGTYRKILEHISAPVLSSPNISIKLNSAVKRVSYKTVGRETVGLQLGDGTECEFDEVVLTTPLGWLQKNKTTTFEPSLPGELSNAIDAISYGCLEKVHCKL
jgi:monoamine oxidase